MKTVILRAIAMSLMLVTTPVLAAVVVEPGSDGESPAMVVTAPVASSDAGRAAEQANKSAAEGGPVTVFNDAISTYASMLPAPANWVLLLTGFSVIGYAMRSRKRGPVSFN